MVHNNYAECYAKAATSHPDKERAGLDVVLDGRHPAWITPPLDLFCTVTSLANLLMVTCPLNSQPDLRFHALVERPVFLTGLHDSAGGMK